MKTIRVINVKNNPIDCVKELDGKLFEVIEGAENGVWILHPTIKDRIFLFNDEFEYTNERISNEGNQLCNEKKYALDWGLKDVNQYEIDMYSAAMIIGDALKKNGYNIGRVVYDSSRTLFVTNKKG